MSSLQERLAGGWWRLAYLLSFPLILLALAFAIVSAFVDWRLAGLFAVWVVILVGEAIVYRRRHRRS